MKSKIGIAIKAMLITSSLLMSIQVINMESVQEKAKIVKALYFAEQCFRDRQEAFVVLLVAMLFLLWNRRNHQYQDKRYRNCFLVGCICFATLMTTSASFAAGAGLHLIFGSKLYILRAIIKMTGYTVMLYEGSRIVLTSGIGQILRNKESVMRGRLENSKYGVISIFLILFICWLPYFILCYPGNMTLDARDELSQIFQQKQDSWTYHTVVHENPDDNAITNHQPVAYTCLIGGLAALGRAMGNINLGIAMCSLIQIFASIAILTYLIYIMVQRNVPRPFVYGSLLFFALFPVFPMYAVTITKDLLFAAVMVWMVLEFMQIQWKIREDKAWKVHGILYVLSAILFCLIRNNGVYILFIMLPFILFGVRRGAKIKVTVLTLVPIVFYFVVFLRIILPLAEIEGGSKREMLCVPFQQTARYAAEWGEEGLTEEDIQVLDKVLCFDGNMAILAERYNPTYADPVKAYYNKHATGEDLGAYIKVWAKMVLRHPGTAVAATLHNNYLLTSSNGCGKIVYVNQVENYSEGQQWYGVEDNVYGKEIRTVLDNSLDKASRLPVIGLLFSLGFYDWILIASILVMIARKQYDSMLAGLFFVMCIATCVLGPIIYMRYALPWILGTPLLGAVLLTETEKI